MPGPDPDPGPTPPGKDPVEYDRLRRRVLWSMPTGLFVVGSRADDRRNLMTCNWVMQIATSPKLVAVAVERDSVTRSLMGAGGGFTVSLLARADRPLVRRFVKPVDSIETDVTGAVTAMQGEPVFEVEGMPCLAAAVAWLACAVRATRSWDDLVGGGPPSTESGSHVLVVGEVTDAGEQDVPDDDAPDGEHGILRMEDTRMNYGG